MSDKKHVCDHVCKYMKYCEAFPLGWQEEMEKKAKIKQQAKRKAGFYKQIIVNNCYGITDGSVGLLLKKQDEQWLIEFKKETCWIPAKCCKET